MKYMASADASALLPAPSSNLSLPLASYFISSSHNTYLMGHQLYGGATVDGYRNVLLRGCRCVEIDCWNGGSEEISTAVERQAAEALARVKSVEGGKSAQIPAPTAEPIVLHGYTATREITFRSVCETIHDYAFVTSDLPLIVSLEVHTNHTQQQMMVDIMNECFKDYLCKPIGESDTGADTPLPSPEKLRNKIMIKVKYSPPSKVVPVVAEVVPTRPSTRTDSSSSSDDEAEKDKNKPKISKIIESLSQLGLYTRSYHFSGLAMPEAKVPTHIFSLSESSLIGLHKDDPEGLFNHNKDFMMRAYPKGTRISSSNLDPSLFWRVGVQMVALNWQKVDKGMMLQEAMFQNTGGWAEKPKSYLTTAKYSDSIAHLSKGRKSWLRISILAAQNLPLPDDVDSGDKMKPFIKCEVHANMPDSAVERKRFGKREDPFKQKTGTSKGQHPQFDEMKDRFAFENLPALEPELSFVRLKVIHSDRFGRDDFSSWACIRLDRLARGLRFIHLWNTTGSPSDGVLLAKIDYGWNVPS
ncbi:PLC-like phosphodiesterase [Microthyrium microscopicum]|uniref:Phosphoinositide phospholipase C n=1 Tax=Microthyrium microscopicum TaxID=703497 RepID=A0A6A6UST1_9PEZI|nr:PLC-like phosphodiesterase [Microthyrium microscopicum]